jgi:hypothetical protein
MSRCLQVAIVGLGVGTLVTVLGCASREDRQRRAWSDEFNQWLGKYKDSRVIEVGAPDHCTRVQNGGGEICEWRTNGNSLLYHYDTHGIARHWTYTDPQLGEMEGAQDSAQVQTQNNESQAGVWQSIKDAFGNVKFKPGGGGR